MLEIVFRRELAFGPCTANKEMLFDIFSILTLYELCFSSQSRSFFMLDALTTSMYLLIPRQ